MNIPAPRLNRGLSYPPCGGLLVAVLSAWFVGLAGLARAEIDTDAGRTVWAMVYGVKLTQASDPTWLLADDDGDGLSNGAELAAGTNPFDARSGLAATAARLPDGSTALTVPTAWGKAYRMQSTADLSNPAAWTALNPAVQATGDGTAKTLTAPPSTAPQAFYRVVAADQDTDGDGLSDWTEHVTGFDPNNAHTHGAAQDDHAALTSDLLAENVVTISADKPSATQPADALTTASDTGTLTITRGGTLHFSTITVPLTWSGTAVPGVDYAALPGAVTFAPKVGSVTLTVVPLLNAARRTAATVTAVTRPGGGYLLGNIYSASVAIAPASNATGTGLSGSYWNSTSALVSKYAASLFAGAPAMTRTDAGINFNWAGASPGTGATGTVVSGTNFVARWTGQVQPQYSETYYFDVVTDDGVKLWVNGQLMADSWASAPYPYTEKVAAIPLKAGVLYDLKMEYYQGAGGSQAKLYWYSDSQPKVLIPPERLYPDSTAAAPPAITSAPTAVGFVNQPFAFTVTASTSGGTPAVFALGANSGPLPPGLSLNPGTGIISGTPTQTGDFQVALTATNPLGTGAATLDIQILGAGSGVTRELWSGLAGAGIADLPLTRAPDSTDNGLATLEDGAAYANNTGERLRGYFTAPATGCYYFWLAASGNAELSVSDDDEPVNLVRRAVVTAPGTSPRNWTDANQPKQRSAWLSLVAGQRYYYEALHNTGGAGASSHVAVGCLMDAAGTATTPVVGASSGVVSGYTLTRYNYPTTTAATGTLYVTNLSPQSGAVSSANGSANLRLLPGDAQASLHFSYAGLSSPQTSYAVYGPDDNGSDNLLFDLNVIDKFRPDLKTPDGGYTWNITSTSAVSAATIVSDIKQGKAHLVVQTVKYPNGEINGNFTLVVGSQLPPVAVADPGYSDDHGSDAGAARFLNQAAFGAAPADMAAVQSGGYAAWINQQIALPATHLLPDVQAQIAASASTNLSATMLDNAWWRAAITGPDQLRQRVAFALGEILVVSDTNSTLGGTPTALASFNDTLADGAFGNFRDLLKATTLHPTMGYWLNMQGNQKGNLTTGYHPNENYAREIMQLFTIGLNRLWPDGSLVLDSAGSLVPTYSQGTITNGFARVFTGWTWHQATQANGQLPTNFYPATNWIDPMVLVKNNHELGTKTLLDNVVLPAATGYNPPTATVAGSQADTATAAYDNYGLQDLESGIDNIFQHPNVGPYVCRQLIQRLVESNPSPGYLQRVVQKFNDDGSTAHVRGNLAAVVRAILLDGEARNAGLAAASPTTGKQREPLMRIAGPARTFPFAANSGTYSQGGTAVTTITTTNPHHFTGGDAVALDFSVNQTGTPPQAPANNPTTGSYTVLTSPAPTANSFAVNAASLASVSCTEAANTTTLTVATSGPPVGESVYLKFITGGFSDGVYTVATTPNSSSFTVNVATAAGATAVTGSVVVPKASGYDNLTKGTTTSGTVTTPSVVSLVTNSNTNLNVGDTVWIVAGTANQLKDAAWTVASVADERHFTVTNTAAYTAETNVGVTLYPLVAPPLTRSGNVALPASKFDMGNTNGQLVQTPLDAPTVFNFFYPDYQFPGTLSANNVTTPEFQLTTDSNIVTLSNTINSTILSSGSTTGLSNFKNGSINLDLGAFMGAPYVSVKTDPPVTSGTRVTALTTTTVDATALVNKLGDLLTGGMLSQEAKTQIIGFVNNTTSFPPTQTATGTTTVPPAAPTLPTASARDKVRAVVQMILVSPEYAVQR